MQLASGARDGEMLPVACAPMLRRRSAADPVAGVAIFLSNGMLFPPLHAHMFSVHGARVPVAV